MLNLGHFLGKKSASYGLGNMVHTLRYSSIFLEEQSKITENASIVGPQQHFKPGLS